MAACTTQMGHRIGDYIRRRRRKPGRTSPSTKVAKAARRRMSRRATWSTAMRSRSSGPRGRPETPEPLLPLCRIPSRYPTRSRPERGWRPVQDRIRGQSIAIIGLGGTGAYILDLVAKTPVKGIHLLDSDYIEWHNFIRAPGAPTAEEIESRAGREVCYKGGLLPLQVRVAPGRHRPALLSEWTTRRGFNASFCRLIPSTMPSCA